MVRCAERFPDLGMALSLHSARQEQILALLREHQGNIAAVARHMGKARMQVQRWLKRYGIDPERFRR